MLIEITTEEREILIQLLTSAIADEREEIYKTETYSYKEHLKTQKKNMQNLLSQILNLEEEEQLSENK
jgi:Spy/CpxP family protein refolding chaperone